MSKDDLYRQMVDAVQARDRAERDRQIAELNERAWRQWNAAISADWGTITTTGNPANATAAGLLGMIEPVKVKPPTKLNLPVTKTVGAIRGFRAWRLTHDERGLALQSAHVGSVWDGPLMHDKTPPEDGYVENWHSNTVHHGIYAAKSFKPLDYKTASVYGEVMLWGKVVVHERGYRAERAMIRRLVVVDHFALLEMPSLPDLLAKRYGCDVSTDIRTLLSRED